MCCSVLQCAAVCCSVLQCVAVCCIVWVSCSVLLGAAARVLARTNAIAYVCI